ncbi:MAG: sensor histidine kinase, partial [Chitinophagaceae bacterium]|nr:sensor histidine kinase [Chitinophagaceae bacterium]
MHLSTSANKNTLFKRIKNLWFKVIGNAADYTLEARIFHSISIALVLLGMFYLPYNFFAGLYVAAASCILLAGFFYFQYYNSRFRKKPHSNAAVALAGILIFSVNYFSNSGINGSTDLIWPSYLVLVIAISPYRQHLLWVFVYVVAFFILHLIEYHYPWLVKHPFDLGKGEFIDRITAFPLPIISITIVISFLRRNYD